MPADVMQPKVWAWSFCLVIGPRLPVCTVARAMRRAGPGQPAGPRGGETCGANLEAAHSLDSCPGRWSQTSQLPAKMQMQEGKHNVVWNHWAGVGLGRCCWNHHWLTELPGKNVGQAMHTRQRYKQSFFPLIFYESGLKKSFSECSSSPQPSDTVFQ